MRTLRMLLMLLSRAAPAAGMCVSLPDEEQVQAQVGLGRSLLRGQCTVLGSAKIRRVATVNLGSVR